MLETEKARLIAKVEKIISGIEADFRKALALEGLYIAVNQNEELFVVGNKKDGTHGLNLINNTIVESLILCLYRIFDNGIQRAIRLV